MKPVMFNDELLTVSSTKKYGNGRTVLQLIDSDGFPYMVASTNIPEVALEKNEILIKDYSENEGVFDALIKAEAVIDTGKRVTGGFVDFPIVTLA